MFNVAVFKMKDIKKYFIGMLVTIAVIMIVSKYFPKVIGEKKLAINLVSENSMLGCLEKTSPVMSNMNEEYKKMENENNELEEDSVLEGVLKTQISSIQGMENIEENEQKEVATNEEQKSEEVQNANIETTTEKAETGLSTQVITNNPIKESYNAEYGKVKIKNETDYELTRRYSKS